MQGSRWVGWPEDKEVSWAWSCVKAVPFGLWEAEVQVTGLSLPERNLASNLSLPSQQPAAGREATLGLCSLIILLHPI